MTTTATKNWFTIGFRFSWDNSTSYTTVYSSMGERYAKGEVLSDFNASEIISCRPATEDEIAEATN